jgi:hypothetical protein
VKNSMLLATAIRTCAPIAMKQKKPLDERLSPL